MEQAGEQKQKMKRKIADYGVYLAAGIVLVTMLTACSRNIVPGMLNVKGEADYEKAAEEYLLAEAMRQKLTGNPGEALKNLEQIIRMNPLNDAAYYQMAQIIGATGDMANSKIYLARAISISPENKWYIIMMAGLMYNHGMIDSTIYYYERLVKFNPGNEQLLMTLGNLYAENKEFDRAGRIFNMLDSKYGVNEISTIALARAMLSEGKFREAREKTEELIRQNPDEIIYRGMLAEIYRREGKPEMATQVYDELLKMNPDNPQAQLSLCEFMIEQRNFDELMALINTVILNDKISRENKIELLAEMMEIDEIVKDHANNMEMAVRIAEAGYPNDDIVLLLRPELYERQEKPDFAALRLEEIIAMRPENYFAWERLLMVYYRLKRYKDLMIRGEEAATRFNRSFLAKMLYAAGASENGEYNIALNELRKAEILAGDEKEMLIQVLTSRGDVYYRMKDYDKAFETFERALEINSEDLTVINNYAYYLAETSIRLKEAEKMAKFVVERENNNSAYLDTYAWALYKNGKQRKAQKIMEKVLEQDEEPHAEWYEHYGYILKKRRKCEEAVKSWEYALTLDSERTYLIDEINNCRK